MTPGVVVGGVLLASDQLLGVEELPVGASPNLFKVVQIMTRIVDFEDIFLRRLYYPFMF